MCVLRILVLCTWACLACADLNLQFPSHFKFGAASSAYQVEGAWNASDKSESIWDRFAHTPGTITDGSNGDIACDSYNNYKRDVGMAAELGLDYYRFSISWPRLLPDGFDNRISEDGKRYYNNLIDELLSKGVEPVVTLYHWDLPQRLQNFGGWTNPLIADWFSDYARVAFTLYGDRVKTWITINEPFIMCDLAHSTNFMAPNITDPAGAYLCTKNVLLAHAKAFRIYDEEFRTKYQGMLSIANQLIWYEGETEDDEDAAEILRQHAGGIYSHPIYSEEGGWPPVIEKLIAEKSKQQGFKKSKLPLLSQEEIELIKGTYDFYAVNYYTTRTAKFAKEGETLGPWPIMGAPDLGVVFGIRPDLERAELQWFVIYPEGLRKQIAWLIKQYGDMKIMITENGYAGGNSRDLQDDKRIKCIYNHLEQVLLSIQEDGVDIIGYTFWALTDNFEWMDGYSIKFGLYEVDFNDPKRTCTPRKSAKYYKKIIQGHKLIPFNDWRDEL